MTALTLDDVCLDYHDAGHGKPLVLVHGSASDHRTFSAQHEVFSRRFRTIVYSRRYHWPNDPIPDGRDYSMMEHVEDLQKILTKLDLGPVHLVGHSYGGFICLLLAIRSPEMIRSLVLAEPPVITLFVSNEPRPQELIKLLLTRPRTAKALIQFARKGVIPATAAAQCGDMETAMEHFGKAVLGPEFYVQLSADRRQQVMDNAIKAELTGSGFPPLSDREVTGVHVPTLLVCGSRSPDMFHRLTDRLEALLPNNQRVHIDDASHIMHEDNADAFNDAVLSFLPQA